VTDKELRDLDIQVAKVVFGMEWEGGNPIPGLNGRWTWPPPYSSNVAATWEVVDKIMQRFTVEPFICENTGILDGVKEWHVVLTPHGEGVGPTAPIAICLAALAAIKAVT
jgi:hypothetical protein